MVQCSSRGSGVEALLISLVIPTRDRSEYLESAIRTAILASRELEIDVEIVIADNASDDRTPSLVSSFADPRIVYIRSKRRTSMRANFESGLNAATGDFVVFIGDDDAFTVDGLKLLSVLLRTNEYDVVNWPQTNYTWPGVRSSMGWGKLRYRDFDGEVRSQSLLAVGQKFLNATFVNYHQGALIYHGCVSRKLIDDVRLATNGCYFMGASPDLYAAVANCFANHGRIGYLNYSVTIGGASPKSNGLNASLSPDRQYSSEYRSFLSEAKGDEAFSIIGPSMKSFGLYVLEALIMCMDRKKLCDAIDIAAWRRRLIREISDLDAEFRAENFACAARLFSLLGDEFIPPTGSPFVNHPDKPSSGGKSVKRLAWSLTSLEVSRDEHAKDIMAFANVIQKVCPRRDRLFNGSAAQRMALRLEALIRASSL